MKHSILKLTGKLFVLAVLFTISLSCSKDNGKDNSGDGTMSLKVDGTAWEASLAVQGVYAQGLFTVSGSDSDAKQANITVLNPEEGKTYNTGGLANYSIMGRWTAGLNQEDTYSTGVMTTTSGEITFTKFTDSHAEGTFSFKARNTSQEEVNITEGTFSVNF